MPNCPMKIALCHHIGGGNLGEDASIEAIRESIRTRWPHSEIMCLPMVRDDFAGKLLWPLSHRTLNRRAATFTNQKGVKQNLKSMLGKHLRFLRSLQLLYRIAKKPVIAIQELTFLNRSFHALRSCDLLVLSASDQFGEATGQHRDFRPLWKYASHVLKWVLLAKIARVRSVLLNVGGTPQQGLQRVFITAVLSMADCVGFRDQQSRGLFSLRDAERTSFLFSDTVYNRNVITAAGSQQSCGAKPVVGIAPMVISDPKMPRDCAFLQRLAEFVVWLINNGYFVRLFCTNINVDSAGVCRMQEILKNYDLDGPALANIDRVHQWSAEELLTNMSSMDYVVTSRFHGVIFAHLLNKPVLAISDHQCVRNLMDNLGLSPFYLGAADSSSNDLYKAFLSMVDRETAIKEDMAAKLIGVKEELAGELDALFPSDRRSCDAVEKCTKALYAH